MKKDKVVYVHKRNDTGAIFYVGMGTARRPKEKQGRNEYWNNIVNKVDYTVEVLVSGVTKKVAEALEISLIAGLRLQGVKLANLTSGGECCQHSEKTKEKMSIAAKNRMTDELKAKISNSVKGFKHTPEAIEKIRIAGLGKRLDIPGVKHMTVNIHEFGTNKLLACEVSYTSWARKNGYTRDKLGKTVYSDKTKPHHSHKNPHHTKGVYAVLVHPQPYKDEPKLRGFNP